MSRGAGALMAQEVAAMVLFASSVMDGALLISKMAAQPANSFWGSD